MFNVKQFKVDSTSGAVDFELVFDGPQGRLIEDQRTFKCEELAITYLGNELKQWLIFKLEKFYHHKKKIAQASGSPFYSSPGFTSALETIWRFIGWACNHNSTEVLTRVFNIEKFLLQALPNANNISYMTSKNEIDTILLVVKNYIDTYKTQLV